MPLYSNGKIYRLVCNKTGLVYVGSTCESLHVRCYKHKWKYEAWKEGKENKCGSFTIIANDDFRIELIENYPCENKQQLTQRERHWYDVEKQVSTLVNISLPYRFYADIQAGWKRADEKRAKNPDRIAYKQRHNRTRYLLKKELKNYNLFD